MRDCRDRSLSRFKREARNDKLTERSFTEFTLSNANVFRMTNSRAALCGYKSGLIRPYIRQGQALPLQRNNNTNPNARSEGIAVAGISQVSLILSADRERALLWQIASRRGNARATITGKTKSQSRYYEIGFCRYFSKIYRNLLQHPIYR